VEPSDLMFVFIFLFIIELNVAHLMNLLFVDMVVCSYCRMVFLLLGLVFYGVIIWQFTLCFWTTTCMMANYSIHILSCIPLWIQVSRFDMLPGIDVKWWGAVNDDVDSFLDGKVISNEKLTGLYRNVSSQVKNFPLVKNVNN
jgi:hypothetical protein